MRFVDGTDLGGLLETVSALEPERAPWILGQAALSVWTRRTSAGWCIGI